MDITTFMMRFGVSGNARPMSQTFTSNGTFVVPAGVVALDLSGSGGRGTDGNEGSTYIYETTQIYATRRSDGARVLVDSNREFVANPSNISAYCGPVNSSPTDPTYSSNQTCYVYDGYTATPPTSATTGASTTFIGSGVNRVFPGSTGSGSQPVTQFASVPVTAGNYSVVVPSGGSLTINYYA